MTQQEQEDLLLLRARWNVSADEAYNRLPWWETELLIAWARAETLEPETGAAAGPAAPRRGGPRPSPWNQVPPGLERL